ncbi:hypothetical protein K1719_021003 [Acacia pycnantha]|nr:hypothetical protein K1719_021003 [Acacia pycnantha]
MILSSSRSLLGPSSFFCHSAQLQVVLSSGLPHLFLASASRLVHQYCVGSTSVESLSSSAMAFFQSQFPPPPVAKKVEHTMEMFGDVRIDNYYWLRDDSRTNPDVLSYLRQENSYLHYERFDSTTNS